MQITLDHILIAILKKVRQREDKKEIPEEWISETIYDIMETGVRALAVTLDPIDEGDFSGDESALADSNHFRCPPFVCGVLLPSFPVPKTDCVPSSPYRNTFRGGEACFRPGKNLAGHK